MVTQHKTLHLAVLVLAGIFTVSVGAALADRNIAQGYQQVNLVSDLPGMARFLDGNLVNSWGIVAGEGGIWVADNGTGLATLYNFAGRPQRPVVTIPPPAGGTTSAPTGVVDNDTAAFSITANGRTKPAILIFATEDGTVSGYNPAVDKTHAVLTFDNSAAGSVFKGIALATTQDGSFLYLTDFHNGVVVVLDQNYSFVKSFFDPSLPPPPIGSPGFAPFGIREIHGFLVVTYALQNGEQHDDVAALGNGFVDIFDPDGNLVRRFASGGPLNSPWGLELAPHNFGAFSDALLVGNFGDGFINAYDTLTGAPLGQLSDRSGNPISINGLWGITFSESGPERDQKLFFAAGLNHEADGLMGYLTPRR